MTVRRSLNRSNSEKELTTHLSLCLTAAAHASSNAHTHTNTGVSGPRPIRRGVRTSLSLIGLDHDMRLTCLLSNSRDFESRRLFFFGEWLDAPVRPTFFFSRTLEKLGRMCDQIGRTLEPCLVSVSFRGHFRKLLY